MSGERETELLVKAERDFKFFLATRNSLFPALSNYWIPTNSDPEILEYLEEQIIRGSNGRLSLESSNRFVIWATGQEVGHHDVSFESRYQAGEFVVLGLLSKLIAREGRDNDCMYEFFDLYGGTARDRFDHVTRQEQLAFIERFANRHRQRSLEHNPILGFTAFVSQALKGSINEGMVSFIPNYQQIHATLYETSKSEFVPV